MRRRRRNVTAMEPLATRWHTRVLVADGAMGTLLFGRLAAGATCVESLNLDAPDVVEQAHRDYLAAGAELIETNSFAANRLKLARHDLAHRVAEINVAAVRRARAAAEERAYVAASVGPLGALLEPIGAVRRDEALDVFAEQASALASAGPDLLLLETFGSVDEAQCALEAARRVARSSPIAVSLSVLEDGRTPSGDELGTAFVRLLDGGADAVGLNCAVGPRALYDALAPVIGRLACPVTVMPNAGYPRRVDDETVYGSSPDYVAQWAASFAALGASVVGGCCGTTPAHVAAMAARIAGEPLRARRPASTTAAPGLDLGDAAAALRRRAPRDAGALAAKLGKRFVITADVLPPRGVDRIGVVAVAAALARAGADAIHVTDDPVARPRMAGTAVAHLIMRETGLPAVLHMSCRDRNLVGLQSDLLGASALGIPAVVALTGDPSNIGDLPKATSVFDVTAVGLVRILRDLNAGRDHAGASIGEPTAFLIGAPVNATPRDLEAECARLSEKADAGAQFVISQPMFEIEPMLPLLERARSLGLPVIVGVLPLDGAEHAEYLRNEVPGIRIPDAIVERLRAAADERLEGTLIARELVVAFARTGMAAGAFVLAGDRPSTAAAVIEGSVAALGAGASAD